MELVALATLSARPAVRNPSAAPYPTVGSYQALAARRS
jgi:hypothetical protein